MQSLSKGYCLVSYPHALFLICGAKSFPANDFRGCIPRISFWNFFTNSHLQKELIILLCYFRVDSSTLSVCHPFQWLCLRRTTSDWRISTQAAAEDDEICTEFTSPPSRTSSGMLEAVSIKPNSPELDLNFDSHELGFWADVGVKSSCQGTANGVSCV